MMFTIVIPLLNIVINTEIDISHPWTIKVNYCKINAGFP